MKDHQKAWASLVMNTLAFGICMAVWMMNGSLMTYLFNNGVYRFEGIELGLLIASPFLTGSLARFPLGLLTDKFGGRNIFTGLMLFVAAPLVCISYADTFLEFLLASLGFGIIGGSFTIVVAKTSAKFDKKKQGTIIGILGLGYAGAALTSIGAPVLLNHLTDGGNNQEAWRQLPLIYAAVLVVFAAIYYGLTFSREVSEAEKATLKQQLDPIRDLRVIRFGVYYFFLFGGFLALSQWLIQYYINVYLINVQVAGKMAALFIIPMALAHAFGGWLSDKISARRVMYKVLFSCMFLSLLLSVPNMDIYTAGKGILAKHSGKVLSVSPDRIVVENKSIKTEYSLVSKQESISPQERYLGFVFLPKKMSWQKPSVKIGQDVQKNQLLARGRTHIFFQANVFIFTVLVFLLGITMGIGSAAVYTHIPDYYPDSVGVVGGAVGVLGGLGGFVCPLLFTYAMDWTGIWSTCWIIFALIAAFCLFWMHRVIQKTMERCSKEELKNNDL